MPGALVRASGLVASVAREALVANTFRLHASPVDATRYGANALRASFFFAKVQKGNPRFFVRSSPTGCARARALFARAVSVAVLSAGGLVPPAAVLVVAEGAVPALLALANVQSRVAVPVPAARIVFAAVLLGFLQFLLLFLECLLPSPTGCRKSRLPRRLGAHGEFLRNLLQRRASGRPAAPAAATSSAPSFASALGRGGGGSCCVIHRAVISRPPVVAFAPLLKPVASAMHAHGALLRCRRAIGTRPPRIAETITHPSSSHLP